MGLEAASIVLGALAGGAVKGLQDSASAVVTDAYQRLRDLLADRFRGHGGAVAALEGYIEDPEVWQRPLEKSLVDTGTLADPAVLEAAERLIALLRNAPGVGTAHLTQVHGSSGVQVNHQGGNTQTNTFKS